MKMKVNFLLLFSFFVELVNSDFSLHFRNFLILRYGADVQRRLDRSDMGFGILLSSFGGKIFETDVIKNDPIIFVHPASCRAGMFLPNYFHYLFKGYNGAELYATTWGDGYTPVCLKTLACDDVKQIRALIVAVNEYTNRTVDVLAFGEGAAIARKAILGGTCVDTKETLGQPLTTLVDTFVAIGGLNYGKQNCTPQLGGCNLNNGQICSSEFMTEINNQDARYEGSYSYYIYSENDFIIGRDCCNHTCTELKNADGNSRQILPHSNLFDATKDIQLEMIRYHSNTSLTNVSYTNSLFPSLF